MKMKILFVLEYYPPHTGGAETIFRNLCERLVKRGHDVSVVTCQLNHTEEFEALNGVKVYRIKVSKKGDRYWFAFLSIPRVYQLAREVDLIHTTTYTGAPPAWLCSRLRGRKCLITVLEVFGSSWKDLPGMNWFLAKLYQFLERLILSLPFDKYVCISRYTGDCLKQLGIKDKKLEVNYCGIDDDLVHPQGINGEGIREKLRLKNSFVYMYYGRPGISKGVEYLLQAIPLISEKIPNSTALLILASHPRARYENLKRMLKALDIEDKIVLLDPVPRSELPSYIAASDCVVVPSLSEGFGFSAAEACALGKPVVASNVGSLPEVVSGNYVLVEPRNPSAIAEGVERVYRGETQKGEKILFSWDECVEKYLEIYDECLGAQLRT